MPKIGALRTVGAEHALVQTKESTTVGSLWKKEFLSAQEVARKLHLSRDSVYRMINEGVIGHVTVGAGRGRIMVPLDEVDHYIESLKAEARKLSQSSG
jgi:excisionase family DNA binding protein